MMKVVPQPKTRRLSKKDGKKIVRLHRQETEDFLLNYRAHREEYPK